MFGGLPRSAETVTSLGGLPFMQVQQVKGEGMSWGRTEDTEENSFPSTTRLSQTAQCQNPTYLVLSPDLLVAQLLQWGNYND